MKYLLITAICALVIYFAYRTYLYLSLADGLSKKIENGAIILDVRTSKEYAMGHIKDAVNIPLGEIRERYTELNPSRTYITTCSHGLRSVKVENLLKEKGFKNVYNGGAWTDLEKIINTAKSEQ